MQWWNKHCLRMNCNAKISVANFSAPNELSCRLSVWGQVGMHVLHVSLSQDEVSRNNYKPSGIFVCVYYFVCLDSREQSLWQNTFNILYSYTEVEHIYYVYCILTYTVQSLQTQSYTANCTWRKTSNRCQKLSIPQGVLNYFNFLSLHLFSKPCN